MLRLHFVGFILICLLILISGSIAGSDEPGLTKLKIKFDLTRLNAEGLQGPPGGLRAMHYEYCIPDRAVVIHKVIAIDPRLQIQWGSPGRVGCGESELLCLGHTYQPNHRADLQRLAALSEVKEIRETHFE